MADELKHPTEIKKALFKHALRWRKAREEELAGKEVEDCDYPSLICPHCASYNIKITSLTGRRCLSCGSTDLRIDIDQILEAANG